MAKVEITVHHYKTHWGKSPSGRLTAEKQNHHETFHADVDGDVLKHSYMVDNAAKRHQELRAHKEKMRKEGWTLGNTTAKPVREEVIDESKVVTIHFHPDYDEHRVPSGSKAKSAGYFTNDKKDAEDTARHIHGHDITIKHARKRYNTEEVELDEAKKVPVKEKDPKKDKKPEPKDKDDDQKKLPFDKKKGKKDVSDKNPMKDDEEPVDDKFQKDPNDPQQFDNEKGMKQDAPPKPVKKEHVPKKGQGNEPSSDDKVKLGGETQVIINPTMKDSELPDASGAKNIKAEEVALDELSLKDVGKKVRRIIVGPTFKERLEANKKKLEVKKEDTQLDEISKDLAKRYIKKAEADQAYNTGETNRDYRRMWMRDKGIQRAHNRVQHGGIGHHPSNKIKTIKKEAVEKDSEYPDGTGAKNVKAEAVHVTTLAKNPSATGRYIKAGGKKVKVTAVQSTNKGHKIWTDSQKKNRKAYHASLRSSDRAGLKLEKVRGILKQTKLDEETSREEWFASMHNLHKLRLELSNCPEENRRTELAKSIEDATLQHAKKFALSESATEELNELFGWFKKKTAAQKHSPVSSHKQLYQKPKDAKAWRHQDHTQHMTASFHHHEQYHNAMQAHRDHAAASEHFRKQKNSKDLVNHHLKAANSAKNLADLHRRHRNREMTMYFHKAPIGELKAMNHDKVKKYLDDSVQHGEYEVSNKREGLESDNDGHIITQLRKVINLRGNKVRFNDGDEIWMESDAASMALNGYYNLRTTIEKEEYSLRLSESLQSFVDLLSGKAAPKADPKKISLAGPKFEDDDTLEEGLIDKIKRLKTAREKEAKEARYKRALLYTKQAQQGKA